MEPLELFLSFLNKFIPLQTDEFYSKIVPFIEVRTIKKKEVVTRIGEAENYINFIGTGLLRKYFVKDGGEIITQISREGQIIHSQESFYSRSPSEYCIDAIETSTLLSISYDKLETIFSSGAAMERLGRLIVTYMMVLNERWQMSLLKLSPRERFLDFVQKNSELMQRVPQKYLASLLNIQPETFSRFKHLLKTPPAHPTRGVASQDFSQGNAF
ncbi:Crp/Fnr family transcriptional regulator [Flavisolibacter nicotianae]|uniref:Crp/Fnr family transcriptional regulator n=1 Tax=Flavisolibacter nicotianae TaxID=2364882 RepID=UPI001F0941DE|nr:Crp/Fnr family transcriptional regulator [Flavisolibacter nicotianae]